MRMSQGVEWVLHCCLNLAWVGPEHPVPAAKLAEFNDLPGAYLNKHLQALGRAGLVASTSGPRGGFRLARDPGEITVLDVVTAIEGHGDTFHCAEIRQRGPMPATPQQCRVPCEIATTMRRAESAWRGELAATTLADLSAQVEAKSPQTLTVVREWFTAAAAPK
jgi:Rrf2 family protein